MHVIFKISCTHLVDLTYVSESLKNIDVKIFCLFIAEVRHNFQTLFGNKINPNRKSNKAE